LRELNAVGADRAQAGLMSRSLVGLWLGIVAAAAGCGYPVDPDKWMPDFGIRGAHGAIALNATDMVGSLTARYLSQEEADIQALQLCGKGCEIVLRFEGTGTCGALASSTNKQRGIGTGQLMSAAAAMAVEQCSLHGGNDCTAKLQGCND
jgi:hypothetical protein